MVCIFFFFKQKTAYEMRISDWSSDVCSSDLFTCTALAVVIAPDRLGTPVATERATTRRHHVQAEVPVPLLPHAAIAVHVDQVPCGLAGQLRVGWQYAHVRHVHSPIRPRGNARNPGHPAPRIDARLLAKDRKSTRLTSSH